MEHEKIISNKVILRLYLNCIGV